MFLTSCMTRYSSSNCCIRNVSSGPIWNSRDLSFASPVCSYATPRRVFKHLLSANESCPSALFIQLFYLLLILLLLLCFPVCVLHPGLFHGKLQWIFWICHWCGCCGVLDVGKWSYSWALSGGCYYWWRCKCAWWWHLHNIYKPSDGCWIHVLFMPSSSCLSVTMDVFLFVYRLVECQHSAFLYKMAV